MRIWDLPPHELCRQHLLGEHRELHALWTILTKKKTGYLHHPETKRWIGKLAALYARHEEQVEEIRRRGYRHASDLESGLATGSSEQDVFLCSIEEQRVLLKNKPCDCYR